MSTAYAYGQFAKALQDASTHGDDEVRDRAGARAEKWAAALNGIKDGQITIGSRVPVKDLPAWVTLEVLWGGYSSGRSLAETPLESDEIELAERLGLPEGPDRRARIFAYYLSDDGLAELYELLDSGLYAVKLPEDAALLTVAWLLRAGDEGGALAVLDAIQPFSRRFRFAPRQDSTVIPPGFTFRMSVGDARKALQARRMPPAIDSMLETLRVWNPYADRLLALWYRCVKDGNVQLGDAAWKQAAAGLASEFVSLKKKYPRSRKVVRKGSNIQWLVSAASAASSADTALTPALAGRVRTAVADMIKKRGAPGSDELKSVRSRQMTVASKQSSMQLASIAAERLTEPQQRMGLSNPSEYTGPVTAAESMAHDIPANTPMPDFVDRILKRTRVAAVDDLQVPSAEAYAALVPVYVSGLVAEQYPEALGHLMAMNYEAFSTRRSLLLLNLEHQVRLDELPWVAAAEPHANHTGGDSTTLTALGHIGEVALERWPGTILPNKLVSQMNNLMRLRHLDPRRVPLVEELAADIFMGTFSSKFTLAAKIAAELAGPTYISYYGIDTKAVEGLYTQDAANPADDVILEETAQEVEDAEVTDDEKDEQPTDGQDFAHMCFKRANEKPGWGRTAQHGKVIEQSQILTTHNLAIIVSLGASLPWAKLAKRAWAECVHLLRLACREPRPLGTVKNAAYAWRQAVFFTSLAGDEVAAIIEEMDKDRSALPALGLVIDGLKDVVGGGTFDAEGKSPQGRRLLGWTLGPHWILEDARKPRK
ncbi:hypothetical protein CcaverHIS002_0300120 [Cutaneotrichosporon cavernicola]|uniref:Uncharacterized protein n=1 Tax=Cutaneotrichosporon cavernicola TaxID=279322 RepID=A0AA48IES4_9TREE|nr:uncharacterized protein CcaverHIS019_0300110 [Cutaneotrichosporon cavernicola]BEI82144.1 hypothetical protein CcaverHIS002_0300120 [Cutaneotrichosporon cavernicola]BEI89941.1 hypothetical protein CcaverHIS019_0300110 [Cutaneotrichosporon cavernicola]BEI97714.1 hypothetical protein CcaverHIS631_0300130 [Cutaneotrichosporon cavernicola]BEJ05491.1 hypothetical protein CcaverHIS641_0300130 [Cutaneotrichosporon cavernicola]